MRLYSSDLKRSVDVGTGSIWYSVYSTAMICLSNEIKKEIPLGMNFLKEGECPEENVKETKKQFKTIINEFTNIPPERAVYNWHKPEEPAPWNGNIAETVSSCADLYTTADGKNLFKEVMELLKYSIKSKTSIQAG